MQFTRDKILDYILDNKFTYARMFEHGSNHNIANFSEETPAALKGRIEHFVSNYPGNYRVELKQDKTHRADFTCRVDLIAVEGAAQPTTSFSGIVDSVAKAVESPDKLYEKVKQDILEKLEEKNKLAVLKKQVELLGNEVKQRDTAAGKFAKALELFAETFIAKNMGALQKQSAVVLQGPPETATKRAPAGFKTSTQLRREAAEASEKASKEESGQEENFSEAQMDIGNAINKLLLLGHSENDVAEMFLNVANACEQHPKLFSSIVPEKLNQIAQFI